MIFNIYLELLQPHEEFLENYEELNFGDIKWNASLI